MGSRGRSFWWLFPSLSWLACGSGPPPPEVEFTVPVSAVEATPSTLEDLIRTTGTLRAAQSAVLTVETPGRVEIARDASGQRLTEGSPVRPGQLIAEITGDDARLAARSEVTRQRHEAAEQAYTSRQRLFEEGLISRESLRDAETLRVEARLEYEQSQLAEERSRLVSPIAGVLLSLGRRGRFDLPVADGQLVDRGLVLAEVAPIDELIAEVDLVGEDLSRVSVGLEARVRSNAWGEETFPGRVVRLAPAVDAATRTARAEVLLANRERRLKPGMFVEVSVVVERREGVATVPLAAVAERGGRRVVFVINGQRVAQREVVLGLADDQQVEVRRGITAGERVVVRGLETLTDGSRVRLTGG